MYDPPHRQVPSPPRAASRGHGGGTRCRSQPCRLGRVRAGAAGGLDILYLRLATGAREPFQVISAYRPPHTNDRLRRSGGGVARGSLHLEGRAIDVRLAGVRTTTLHDAALELQRGGVGYYRDSDFVHVDTGRVRRW